MHIPVKLFSATRKELHFHYLHDQDLGRVKNERVCRVEGKRKKALAA